MSFLTNQIHFLSSLRRKALAAVILGSFLSVVIIFLEPFDTNLFESDNRTIILLGFGLVLSITFFIQTAIENIWYVRVNKIWVIWNEILSTIGFFIFSGTTIYLYNHFIVNKLSYSFQSHWWYYTHIVIAMIPVIAPVFLYLRHKFGERILPISQNSVAIIGDNKNEKLALQKKDLLFIHAVENYIDIYFNDVHNKVSSKTFRQTLSKVHLQLPFLEKCHRSYLVNIENIIEIKGNSQSAKIYFENYNGKIPLSKTQYKLIKTAIGNQKKGDPQH